MIKNEFGQNLTYILETLKMSQHELSKRTGLTEAAISQILNGKREPALGTIIKILKVIPVKFEILVNI